MTAQEVYNGSNGELTKAYYAELKKRGPVGEVAVALFRASKCSGRAKLYRGRRYKDAAYDTKQWSMGELCRLLKSHSLELGIRYGWKEDPNEPYASWVLYVDLEQGQVSFHTPQRLDGPDYPGEWDGIINICHERIIRFCEVVERIPLGSFPQDSSSFSLQSD
jgi:hypothetical protein